MSLPKKLFVCEVNKGTEDRYLSTSDDIEGLEFDDPTEVGEYTLAAMYSAKRTVETIKKR